MRKFRAYLEVMVPREIAQSAQAALDVCMELAKNRAKTHFAGCVTVPTCLLAVASALATATAVLTGCFSLNPIIAPHLGKIKIDVKTDSNA